MQQTLRLALVSERSQATPLSSSSTCPAHFWNQSRVNKKNKKISSALHFTQGKCKIKQNNQKAQFAFLFLFKK